MLITTDNPSITLRLLGESDAETLCRLVDQNRAYLRQWLPWLDNSTCLDHTRAFIQGTMKRYAQSGVFTCGLRYQDALVGVIGHIAIDKDSRVAYPGYWLSQSHTGQGIMTCAVRALINHAFDELTLNRIHIQVAVGNRPSQGICDRLGFRQEGIIREAEWLYDHFVDHTINGLLRSEWVSKSSHR